LPKKGAEKVSSTVSSNIQKLALQYCKLSDEFFSIVLPWFVNVKELDIRGNNFTVIPECIKECFFLTSLYLHHCKLLQEIRGIPPNLKYFSAKNCLSLTSSCRSKLLNLVLSLMYLINLVIHSVFNVAKLDELYITNRNCMRLETPTFICQEKRFQSGLSTRPGWGSINFFLVP